MHVVFDKQRSQFVGQSIQVFDIMLFVMIVIVIGYWVGKQAVWHWLLTRKRVGMHCEQFCKDVQTKQELEQFLHIPFISEYWTVGHDSIY